MFSASVAIVEMSPVQTNPDPSDFEPDIIGCDHHITVVKLVSKMDPANGDAEPIR